MKTCKLLKYKDRYKDQAIVIIGSGYGLNNLTPDQIKIIENDYISIGCNQSYLKVKSNYYISGHLHHSLMQYHFGGDTSAVVFQGEPQNFYESQSYNVDVLTDINIVGEDGYLPLPDNGINIPLVGAEQIGFSATHLAYIFGAKKIIYIGFDFSAKGHFYNIDSDSMSILKSNADFIRQKYYGKNTFIDEDIDDFYTFNLRQDINIVAFRNSDSIIDKFGSYIKSLIDFGVEPYTIDTCVLNNFGCKIIEL